jgi:hypothetical protein
MPEIVGARRSVFVVEGGDRDPYAAQYIHGRLKAQSIVEATTSMADP